MKTAINYALAYLAFAFWLGFGLYFGLAGVLYTDLAEEKAAVITESLNAQGEKVFVYDGINFSSMEKARVYRDEMAATGMFSWFRSLPSKLILFLTSMALGGLGGVIGVVKQVALANKNILELKPFWSPMLGALIGLLVLGISYLLPVLLTTTNEVEIRSTTLIFVSLFAGLYARQFLNFLESRFSNYLNKLNENEA